MSNEYATILLHDRVQSTLIDAFYYVSPQSTIGQKLSHMLSILYFSQGEYTKVRFVAEVLVELIVLLGGINLTGHFVAFVESGVMVSAFALCNVVSR